MAFENKICPPGQWTLITPNAISAAAVILQKKGKSAHTPVLLRATATNASPATTYDVFNTSVPIYPGQILLTSDTPLTDIWPGEGALAYLHIWVPEFQAEAVVGVNRDV